MELVSSLDQSLIVALIRNECCQWMTGNRAILSVGQQTRFFETNKDRDVFLFRWQGKPCGYGVMMANGSHVLLTIGIAKIYRGLGLGRAALEKLMAKYSKFKIDLSVLKKNWKAIRLYKSLGFQVVRQTKRQLVMRHE